MTKAIEKHEITSLYLRTLKARAKPFLIWDEKQGGLAFSVLPSGHMAWKAIYSRKGRTRWYTIGPLSKVGLAEARKLAKNIMARVAWGKTRNRKKWNAVGKRKPLTFAELAAHYLKYIEKKA